MVLMKGFGFKQALLFFTEGSFISTLNLQDVPISNELQAVKAAACGPLCSRQMAILVHLSCQQA